MYEHQLSGKVALITGAGSGIGRASALLFARAGAKVVIAELSAVAAAETARLIGVQGGECLAVETDVRLEASVEAAMAAAVDRFGGLDVLYNNAGGSTPADARVGDAGPAEFWRAISVDLFGTWLCCHYALPHLIARGGGVIINAASIVALRGIPGKDAYTAAKGAIVALTRSMAVEYAANRVRVNALAPSTTRTERILSFLASDTASQDVVKRHLLGLPDPADIAHAALFLASDAARMITGHVLPVDSGLTCA